MLPGNLNEVFNFRLFASCNLPELLYISVYSPGSYLSIHVSLVGKFCLYYQTTISVKNYRSSFVQINMWYIICVQEDI